MTAPMLIGVFDDRSLKVSLTAGSSIELFLTYRIKGFPENKWHAQGFWSVPLTEPNINYLDENFATHYWEADDEAKVFLEYHRKTLQLAKMREQRRWKYVFNDDRLSVSSFQYPDVCHTRVADTDTGWRDYFLWKISYRHQAVALDALHNQEYFALFMEMGTGKTKVVCDEFTLCCHEGAKLRVVVVCPKTIITTWKREIEKWVAPDISRSTHRLRTGLGGTEKLIGFVQQKVQLKVLLVNYERVPTMLEQLKVFKPHILVCDESTKIKTPGASRSKAVHELAEYSQRRIILSGNPVTNGVCDLFSQFEVLSRGSLGYSSYYAFRKHYLSVRRRLDWDTDDLNSKLLDELKRTVARHSFIVKKEQCLDLPDKVYETRQIAMGKEQRALYEQMVEWFMAEMASETASTSGIVEARAFISKLLRLSQITQGFIRDTETHGKNIPIKDGDGKLRALVEILEEVPTHQKLIVYARFHYDVDAICAMLAEKGIGYLTATGRTPKDDIENLEERFNGDDSIRVLVGEPSTCGMGLTLIGTSQHPCLTVVYYSNDYSWDKRLQSEDRCHRIGMIAKVTYIDLVCTGSIDEHILGKLREKKAISEAVKDMESVRAVLLGDRVDLDENGGA